MPGADELFVAALRLEDAGRPEEALERYRDLLRQAPAHADAWHNHGLLLARLGRLEEAEQSHRSYVRLNPSAPRAFADLADVLLARERYDDALEQAGRAADLDPAAHLPRFTAGLASAMLERFADSEAWFVRALQANPAAFQAFLARHWVGGSLDRDLDPRAIFLIRQFDRLETCDWRGYERYVDAFRRLVAQPPPPSEPPLLLRSLALPLPLASRRRLADAVAGRIASRAAALRVAPPPARGTRPARIGYVSPDFRTHPTGILSAPLFGLHDRARFEVHAFSLSPGDDSVWRRQIESSAAHFHSLVGMSLQQALAHVRGAQIDILVDLAGATTGGAPELFAARAAPVQVAYLGFPGSSGTGIVDYLICDDVVIPEEEAAGYGEALARLPQTFWICAPPSQPRLRPSRHSCGLPEDAVVLYAHHPGQKIHPEIFDVWMEILRQVPRAVLWLLENRPGMRHNLLAEAQNRGIAAGRLVFASRVPLDDYHARIPLADLALDTPLYNGGATTLDALGAGVPVLTCSAPGFAGRMAASALRAAGLDELVFSDLRAYCEAAIRLATHAGERLELARRTADARSSALFDTASRARQLETAFEQMLQRAGRGEPPRSFRVPRA